MPTIDNRTTSEYKGVFFAVDGPNGSGKTTLIHNVLDQLKNEFPDYGLSLVHEPSESDIGTLVRKYSEEEIHNSTLLYLVAADRQYNHIEVIRRQLAKGNSIVVSDRYVSSSLVYQIMHGLSVEEILTINYNIYIPDVIILLECPLIEMKKRLYSRKSSNFFENPHNVETEVTLFRQAAKILDSLKYHIEIVKNEDLNETTSTVMALIRAIIAEKRDRSK